MTKIVSIEHMRAIEAGAEAEGLTSDRLMERAGRAAGQRILEIVAPLTDARVTFLIGAGNNGGDGLVAAYWLAQNTSVLVRLYLLKARADDDPTFAPIRKTGLPVVLAEFDHDRRVLRNMVSSADVVVDALFGIGVRLPLNPDVTRLLRTVRQALHDDHLPEDDRGSYLDAAVIQTEKRHRGPYVLALDCPSGLDCDTGNVDDATLSADETMTFIAVKQGLLRFPGAARVGKLTIADCGVDPLLEVIRAETNEMADAVTMAKRLPARPNDGHKGTFGRLLLVGGSARYTGAVALAVQAAYRVGVGLVTAASTSDVIGRLAGQQWEATWLPLSGRAEAIDESAVEPVLADAQSADALLIGPGMGTAGGSQNFLLAVLDGLHERFEGGQSTPGLVLDADGLNLISTLTDWWTLLPTGSILTPHPGEMARLCGISIGAVQEDRVALARSKAVEWQATLILKGAHTVVAGADGRCVVMPFKSSALAKAGTGDVLAGLTAGLVAQGCQAADAAALATYIHGAAGLEAARVLGTTRSVIAQDVLKAVPHVLAALETYSI